MLRALLLRLSRSERFDRFCNTRLPFRFARTFVGGRNATEALQTAIRLQEQGYLVTLHYLGEEATTLSRVKQAAKAYHALLRELSLTRLKNPSISVKLTHLGLGLGEGVATAMLRDILIKAKARGIRVEIDMEAYHHFHQTLRIYQKVLPDFPHTGFCVQAYLRSAPSYLRQLLSCEGATIRLVNGAYQERADVVLHDEKDIRHNYEFCLHLLFSSEAKKSGVLPLISTHDELLIAYALRQAQRNAWKPDTFEIEMFYRMRPDVQRTLLGKGYRVRVHLPYGARWFSFTMRRIAELPFRQIMKSLSC